MHTLQARLCAEDLAHVISSISCNHQEPGIVLTSQDNEAQKSNDSPGAMKLMNRLAGHRPHVSIPKPHSTINPYDP